MLIAKIIIILILLGILWLWSLDPVFPEPTKMSQEQIAVARQMAAAVKTKCSAYEHGMVTPCTWIKSTRINKITGLPEAYDLCVMHQGILPQGEEITNVN